MFDVAEAVNARVILVGDRRQHRSVTAGEPLKLLEEKAGLRVAEVTEILRQQGDYKKAAEALSEGRTEEAFEELDKLGWIKQVPMTRPLQATGRCLPRGRCGKEDATASTSRRSSCRRRTPKADRITEAIRAGLKAKGKLGEERIVDGLGSDAPDRCPESRPDANMSRATCSSSTRMRRATRKDRG